MREDQSHKLFTVLPIHKIHVSLENLTFQSLIQLPGCLSRLHHDFFESNDCFHFRLRPTEFLIQRSLNVCQCSCSLVVQYLTYHVSMWSCKLVTNVAFSIWSPVMFLACHTTFSTNQNWSKSSFPKPLKMGNFIVFTILNGGTGGGDMGEGVCYGGDDGGGVGEWGIRGNPCLINWTTLCVKDFVAPSSSLRGGSINGLYSWPILLLSLNNFPLCIAPIIRVIG